MNWQCSSEWSCLDFNPREKINDTFMTPKDKLKIENELLYLQQNPQIPIIV
jgi:hypothetical protein